MEDPRLQRLFTSLGATFEAEIARDEEEAAHDLAFSLRQGRSLTDVLERGSWRLLTPAGPRPITLVGADYVVAGGVPAVVAPLDRAAFDAEGEPRSVHDKVAENAPPPAVDATFLQLLRSLARVAAPVRIGCRAGPLSGRLLCAGTDHVAVEAPHRRMAISLQAIDWIVVEEGIGAGDS
jgi:hypothetical protein